MTHNDALPPGLVEPRPPDELLYAISTVAGPEVADRVWMRVPPPAARRVWFNVVCLRCARKVTLERWDFGRGGRVLWHFWAGICPCGRVYWAGPVMRP